MLYMHGGQYICIHFSFPLLVPRYSHFIFFILLLDYAYIMIPLLVYRYFQLHTWNHLWPGAERSAYVRPDLGPHGHQSFGYLLCLSVLSCSYQLKTRSQVFEILETVHGIFKKSPLKTRSVALAWSYLEMLICGAATSEKRFVRILQFLE